MAFNLNGLTQVITRTGNLGAETKSWKEKREGREREREEGGMRQPYAKTSCLLLFMENDRNVASHWCYRGGNA